MLSIFRHFNSSTHFGSPIKITPLVINALHNYSDEQEKTPEHEEDETLEPEVGAAKPGHCARTRNHRTD